MFLTKLAAVGATALLALGLGMTPANAAQYMHLQNVATHECLDFRADFGPYVTGCNEGAFQTWIMTLGIAATAMRQQATQLCLVARNGQPVMRDCLAGDDAALWEMISTPVGSEVRNKVTRTCLVAGSGSIHHVSLGECTGGDSRQWTLYG